MGFNVLFLIDLNLHSLKFRCLKQKFSPHLHLFTPLQFWCFVRLSVVRLRSSYVCEICYLMYWYYPYQETMGHSGDIRCLCRETEIIINESLKCFCRGSAQCFSCDCRMIQLLCAMQGVPVIVLLHELSQYEGDWSILPALPR